MNLFGLRLKSASRSLRRRISTMERRVRFVSFCRKETMSGGRHVLGVVVVGLLGRFAHADAAAADLRLALAVDEACLGDHRALLDFVGAGLDEGLGIEAHPEGRLVLDAVPEFLEVFAQEAFLVQAHLASVRRRS